MNPLLNALQALQNNVPREQLAAAMSEFMGLQRTGQPMVAMVPGRAMTGDIGGGVATPESETPPLVEPTKKPIKQGPVKSEGMPVVQMPEMPIQSGPMVMPAMQITTQGQAEDIQREQYDKNLKEPVNMQAVKPGFVPGAKLPEVEQLPEESSKTLPSPASTKLYLETRKDYVQVLNKLQSDPKQTKEAAKVFQLIQKLDAHFGVGE